MSRQDQSSPPIESFRGRNAFLSNFYPCRPRQVYILSLYPTDLNWFKTVEHAYQASKFESQEKRDQIRLSEVVEAKRLGQSCGIRSDWDDIRLQMMAHLLRQKFADPFMQKMILRTRSAKLIEGNHWNDTCWGVCNGKGKNHLGRLLEQIRSELQSPRLF